MFHWFLDFQHAHQGVTGVISGGKFAQNHKKIQFYLMLLKVIDLNRCLHTINGLRAQDKNHEKPFQYFSDLYTNHRGVMRVISGGNFAQNHTKIQFYLMLLKVIDLNRCLNTINELQAQNKDHETPFRWFLNSYTNHQGSAGSFPGVIFPKITKNRNFILCYSQ